MEVRAREIQWRRRCSLICSVAHTYIDQKILTLDFCSALPGTATAVTSSLEVWKLNSTGHYLSLPVLS